MRASIAVVGVVGVTVLGGAGASSVRSSVTAASAEQAAPATGATTRIAEAAQAFLKTLDDAGRAKVQYRFDDAAQRQRWSNLPSPIYGRQGLRVGDMTPPQRQALTTLLQAALSPRGYTKVNDIMRGDEVLREGQAKKSGGAGPGPGRRGPRFGADEY